MGELVTMEEFIKRARKEGIKITWPSLQVYYSPRMKLMPKPVHVGGHKSHYDLNNLDRLKLIKALTKRLPLAKVKKILKPLSERDVKELASVVKDIGVDEDMLDVIARVSRSGMDSIKGWINLGVKARNYHLKLWDVALSGFAEDDATRMAENLFPQPRGAEEEVEHEQMKYGLWYEISKGAISKKELLEEVLLNLYRDAYCYDSFRQEKLKEREETVKEYEKQ